MWFWIIIFFPVFGCIIYLYNSFYNRHTIKTITEGVKEVVISNYRIEQLEKELRFSDTITNKINLADAYVSIGRYKDAIELYTDCLKGFMADDPTLRMKVMHVHFLDKDYESTIAYGTKLESEKSFKSSEAQIAYAWALHYQGKNEEALTTFKEMDKSFTNYNHRKEYCKYLLETNKRAEAKNKLAELLTELEHMSRDERRIQKQIISEIKSLYNSLSTID